VWARKCPQKDPVCTEKGFFKLDSEKRLIEFTEFFFNPALLIDKKEEAAVACVKRVVPVYYQLTDIYPIFIFTCLKTEK
jgi:hypothetical protein